MDVFTEGQSLGICGISPEVARPGCSEQGRFMDPVHEPRARTTDVAVSPGPHVLDFGLSDSSMLILNGNVTARHMGVLQEEEEQENLLD